ncbi:MAG: hypothetical protein P4L49_08900 [Desulfosporosinus sp.]|nr:hypothetical protein [Desulfosporosinus sp.]
MTEISDAKGLSASTIENKFAAISSLAGFLNKTNILQNIRKTQYRKNRNIAPKSLERNDRNKMLREVERSQNLRTITITYFLLLVDDKNKTGLESLRQSETHESPIGF